MILGMPKDSGTGYMDQIHGCHKIGSEHLGEARTTHSMGVGTGPLLKRVLFCIMYP